ncbi:MATE family efflux transporter [Spiroplasma culicicola]|uniref:MATE efflux family protein n=1 Tax=Spiroplasma culicicola AES-1 TaxID=1276246 RepID=W6AFM6_9MOLU|nr:MATE family efflux transporter [Spiroplasma culicicola]AHI52499.1 MATE efflux family protein [Spiroplasma culicicola AES-1]
MDITEKFVDHEFDTNNVTKNGKTKRRFFATGQWYKIALTLILWSVLQEIVMASTDLIDNIFVNSLRDVHIGGYQDFINYIDNSGWSKISNDLLIEMGLANFIGEGIYYSAGQIAVNGVSASNQLFIIMFAMVTGFCYGAGIFGAQYFGANEFQKLKQINALKMYLVFGITMVFALFALPGITHHLIGFTTHPNYDMVVDPLTETTATDKDKVWEMYKSIQNEMAKLATQEGTNYYRIVSLSYPLLTINQVAITALRETRRPFYSFFMSAISLVANLTCNIFLTAPTFLGDFQGFGIEGAAFGTVASRILQTFFVIGLLSIKRFEFIPSIRHFKIQNDILRRSLSKSLPILMSETLFAFGMVMQVKLRAQYSVDSLSANAMYETMLMAFFSPMYHGLNAGISTLVGNELGAEKFDRAKYNAKHLMRLSFIIGIVFMTIFSGLSFVIPKLIFPHTTAEGLHIGEWMIFMYTMVYPIIMINNCVYSILRAGGNVFSAFSMDSGYNWVVQIPILALLVLANSNQGGFINISIIHIHLIYCAFEVLKIIPAIIYYKREKWVTSIISEKIETKKVKQKRENTSK